MTLEKILEGKIASEALEILEGLQLEIPRKMQLLKMEVTIEELREELNSLKEERDHYKELYEEVKPEAGETTTLVQA